MEPVDGFSTSTRVCVQVSYYARGYLKSKYSWEGITGLREGILRIVSKELVGIRWIFLDMSELYGEWNVLDMHAACEDVQYIDGD